MRTSAAKEGGVGARGVGGIEDGCALDEEIITGETDEEGGSGGGGVIEGGGRGDGGRETGSGLDIGETDEEGGKG